MTTDQKKAGVKQLATPGPEGGRESARDVSVEVVMVVMVMMVVMVLSMLMMACKVMS